jgi:hypothetical protein
VVVAWPGSGSSVHRKSGMLALPQAQTSPDLARPSAPSPEDIGAQPQGRQRRSSQSQGGRSQRWGPPGRAGRPDAAGPPGRRSAWTDFFYGSGVGWSSTGRAPTASSRWRPLLGRPVPWAAEACRQAGVVHVGDSVRVMSTLGGYTHVPTRPVGDARDPRGRARWQQSAERFADRVEAAIEAHAPGFSYLVLARRIWTPATWPPARPAPTSSTARPAPSPPPGSAWRRWESPVCAPTQGVGRRSYRCGRHRFGNCLLPATPPSGSRVGVRLRPRPSDITGFVADVAGPASRGGLGTRKVAGL